jgi:hypothetical protein
MKKRIENIEIYQEKGIVKFYIECDCGFTQDYFAKEVLNFFKSEQLIKNYDIGVYGEEPYGEVDKLYMLDMGLDSEKQTMETLSLYEFVDENYEDFEWFLYQK